MMANRYLADIGMNDSIQDVIRKCNQNFRILLNDAHSDQVDLIDISAYIDDQVESINQLIQDEAEARTEADADVIDEVSVMLSHVAGALVYKGTVTAESGITGENYKKGWYWVVNMPLTDPATTSITIAGIDCEAGDMVIAKQDKTATLANDIDIIQANIAVIGNSEIDTITAS